MGALLRAIAAALRSWVRFLGGKPAARRVDSRVDVDDDGHASHETRGGVEMSATEEAAGDEASRPIDEQAKEPPNHQATDDNFAQLSEVAATDAATDDIEDHPDGAARDETAPAPGEAQVTYPTVRSASSDQEKTANADHEPRLESEQPAEEQETVAAATAGTPVESIAETVGLNVLGPCDRLAGEPNSEEDTAASAETKGSEFDDSALVSDVVDMPVPPEGLDAVQIDPGEPPGEKSTGDGPTGGVRRDADTATRERGPSGGSAGGSNGKYDSDDALPANAMRKGDRQHAPQYRAPAGGPPPRRRPSQSQTKREDAGPPAQRDRPAPIDVRVIFHRGGHCIVSLLPHRLPGLADELVVSSEAGNVELLALQDEWYQDVAPDDLGRLLRAGIVWKHLPTGQEWLLSRREVFVLAHGTTHRGFVSCTRLALGREHVVLCSTTKLGPVEDALRAAGCAGWMQLGEDDGAPSGWRVLREVVPRKPVLPSGDDDILNILRPLPEIEIALEGGIRLAYNTWLLGHPPAIRVYGDPEHTETVLIDGQTAAGSEQHGYTVPGWDVEGEHQIWCSSTEKSYSLVRCETGWPYWPAYSFALDGARGQEFEFCGPLVRPVAKGGRSDQRQVVQVSPTNPVLLGALPGEVFFARPRLDLRAAQCFELPPFDPVWALPRHPLRCDKRANRILFVGEPAAESSNAPRESAGVGSVGRNHELWCRLILDAGRKGLAVEPAGPVTRNLWRDYKRLARSLWRRLR